MPAWLKRKTSGASGHSIKSLKVRILNDHGSPFLFHTIRRTGSRVLTALRHRQPSTGNSLSTSCDVTLTDGTAYTTHSRQSKLISSILPCVAFASTTIFGALKSTSGNGMDGQDSPKIEITVEQDTVEPARSSSATDSRSLDKLPREIRHSMSSPNLDTSVRNRSVVQSNTTPRTVVRRPSLASKPTIVLGERDLDSFVPSPPFGFHSARGTDTTSRHQQVQSSTPLSQVSTAPTSVLSSSNSGQYGLLASIPELSRGVLEFHNVPTIATDSQKVTIVTVEKAAAAKIHLETHFNELLAIADGRTLRRQLLESYLANSFLLAEEHEDVRKRWEQAESNRLRLARSMQTLRNRKPDAGSVSHYNVIRVLGKGNFGVVQLVHDKGMAPLTSRLPHDTPELSQLRNELYAVKTIRKSSMLRNGQEGHVRAERDFLVASEQSQWVVPLIESFQDASHLYLVMEYMVGGDFLGLLLRFDILPEHDARFYIAEMILCVEEVHKMNWIHRDVKPDNFLISASGHLKISDFGLAFSGHWSHYQSYYNETRQSLVDKLKIPVNGDFRDIEERKDQEIERQLAGLDRFCGKPSDRPEGKFVLDKLNSTWKRRLARSVVGTSQYMSPEVIRDENYDGRCDWWSVGIILFECLFGSTPFYCDTRADTKARIVQNGRSLRVPSGPRYHMSGNLQSNPLPAVSREAKDLIKALLSSKEQRLSSTKYLQNDVRGRRHFLRSSGQPSSAKIVFENDAEDIKKHRFFENMDWHTLHLQTPPFVPHVTQHQPITKYFDNEQDILGSSDEAESGPKPKQRARDKILRDQNMAEAAMKVRKNCAFLGYEYRNVPF